MKEKQPPFLVYVWKAVSLCQIYLDNVYGMMDRLKPAGAHRANMSHMYNVTNASKATYKV